MRRAVDVMDQASAQAETAAVEAFMAVIGDAPQDARRVIDSTSFRDRALIIAWAEELVRLTRQGQDHYESRERSAWRGRDTDA